MDFSVFSDFGLQGKRTIALVGAGGKTSLMRWLADCLASQGARTVLTTTTKFSVFPDLPQFFYSRLRTDFLSEIERALQQHRTIVVAEDILPDIQKCAGFSPAALALLQQQSFIDYLLVEADGAARKPLKAPAEYEPVMPENTDLCIGVIGLEVLGELLQAELVHRHLLFSKITGCQQGEMITLTHLEKLVAHPEGLFKKCCAGCEKRVFLNKYDAFGDALRQAWRQKTFSLNNVEWWAGSVQQKKLFLLKDTEPVIV